MDKENDSILRTILAKNPHKTVQIEACLSLAQSLIQRGAMVRRIRANPELAKQLEQVLGKEQADELTKTDVEGLDRETREVLQEFKAKYLSQINSRRLQNLCQTLSTTGGKAASAFLRDLLENDKRREVRGVACLTLAQGLKRQAEDLPAAKFKESRELQAECEKLFERAVRDFGDVKLAARDLSDRNTVGAKAKGELFGLRHLALGKQAPEMEGQDQDGKHFKLSDYKGKVVLLDFWSQF
jgi:hypothetical protein